MIRFALCLLFLGTHAAVARANEPPRTGPQTERRFPPLKVPAGFKATLFACDPLIEYPSVISDGPNGIFVAIDYMTGLGYDITRRDEIRLVQDTDGDGYADKATVFAKGFNSIQGLCYHNGTLYVMHAPFLTALRDTKGTCVADERRDLLTGLGLTPEQNPTRLHCANGIVAGHDGWLYLAMGDNGVDVKRPEGDRLVLHGGGILRCRPDGRDLHVFATGLRNIYDVALDAELNVFVRDNENDGGTYMIRVCHSFHGADHGYPYLYDERPDEALADLGLGSSAGGVCYLESQFPPEYRGNQFFCEWGRSVVRYAPERKGSGFGALKEIEFATGAADDPYGFKPTDIIVQSDGTMMVSDWGDGQRPKRGRGRIYRITPDALKILPGLVGYDWMFRRLNSESYSVRCGGQNSILRMGGDGRRDLIEALNGQRVGQRGRMHAVWVLAQFAGSTAIDDLLRMARSDQEPSVRAQAIRAAADLSDPVLISHKLDAGPGDAKLAERLAALAVGEVDRVRLEVVVALGRLQWAGLPNWLRKNIGKPDAALSHAAQQALRRSKNWSTILKLLDEPAENPIRAIALRAIAEQYELAVVDWLIEKLRTEPDAARRREYADALTRVYKKPGPWTYWGYRPAPRPVNTVAWERTDTIANTLDGELLDDAVRLPLLRRMQREKIPVTLARLRWILGGERRLETVAVMLKSLSEHPADAVRPLLVGIIQNSRHATANRQAALAMFIRGLGENGEPLLDVAQTLEDSPVRAEAVIRLGQFPKVASVEFLMNNARSITAEVPSAALRAAAIEALGELRAKEAERSLAVWLSDKDARVRRAAAGAAGKLGAKSAVEPLLKLASDEDPGVRHVSLKSLLLLREPRTVPLAVNALNDREAHMTALQCVAELGGPEQASAVVEMAKHNPSVEVLGQVVRVLTTWRGRDGLATAKRLDLDRRAADVHGNSGTLTRWIVRGPTTFKLIDEFATIDQLIATGDWRTLFATGSESRVQLAPKRAATNDLWSAFTEIAVPESVAVEFRASSSGSLRVWLNGQSLFRRDEGREFQVDSDRFNATLVKGRNRILVQVGPAPAAAEFHLRFRRKSATADHERLAQAALTRPGNVERGRALFLNAEKSQCMKCHRLGDQGEPVGPHLRRRIDPRTEPRHRAEFRHNGGVA